MSHYIATGLYKNQKMSKLRCTATWGHLTLHQSFSTSNETPVPSLKSVNLSVAVLQHFYCRHVMLPCNLDLWPWTFVVYHLWCSQTNQIWAKSNNPRWSYGEFNIPCDLLHVSHVLWSGIIFIQLNCSFVTCNDFLTLIRFVTLWPWPLTLNFCSRSGDKQSNSVPNLSEF